MKKSYFSGLIVLQIILLGFIAARYEYILKTGASMKVLVQGVDPLDFFRGQYVALNYPLSVWTGSVSDDVRPGSRVYLSTSQTSTGVTDKIRGLYNSRSDCPDAVCIGAKLNNIERRTTMLVTYSYDSGSGKIITRTNEEYTLTDYDYGYSLPSSDQKFKEWEKVQVSVYDTKSGNIGGVYKYTDPQNLPKDSAYVTQLAKTEPPLPNGTITKILRTEAVARMEFDANRFYVQEGKGYDTEKLIRDSQVYANLRVGKNGETVLESLENNGTIIR